MSNSVIKTPVIYETKYDVDTANQLNNQISRRFADNEKDRTLLTEYPTVYVINDLKNSMYTVYVGETNDIQRRTLQHLDSDPKERDDFSVLKKSNDASMYVIGHEHFNKSMTLDIENRLMQYLSSVPKVKHLNNRRHNEQNRYYDSDEFERLFNKIWKKLGEKNSELFPKQRIIESSALIKVSPFNKLTNEQLKAKSQVIEKINLALFKQKNRQQDNGELILVEGDAGSGKTVLMSNIFYDVVHENNLSDKEPLSVAMLVNQNEQLKVYEEIASKLFDKKDKVKVEKPVTFIKNTDPKEKADIVLVDEAHLLLTQSSQSYSNDKRHPEVQVGTNMLKDIIKRAKVVMAVFDPKQILSTEAIWDDEEFSLLEQYAGKDNIIHLHNQMRIDASKATVDWIQDIIDKGIIGKIPKDDKYKIKIFNDSAKMQEAITLKNNDQDQGISRMVATFDWEYSGGKRKLPKGQNYWEVKAGDWKMPWNYEIDRRDKYEKNHSSGKNVKYKNQSWAEKDYTVNEIGSTYTIQGFDLNYVGVVLGPSVKYRDGKIVHDPSESENSKATQKRDSKKSYAERLLNNELNVLLTRGVHGLYIYAVDPKLRKALNEAEK